ncbi:patatin-like phospholipase [Aspergillus heterothallicus]
MHPKTDNSWLEVHSCQNGVLVQDYGQLDRVISDLPQSDQQYPTLSVFLGGRKKDRLMQAIFPHNNIRRTRSRASVGLRCETTSAETNEPWFFADGDMSVSTRNEPAQILPGTKLIPCGPTSAESALQKVYSRLLFPFANLICVFALNFQDLVSVAQYLVDLNVAASPPRLPLAARPKVIVVLEDDGSMEPVRAEHEVCQFYRLVRQGQSRLQESFSSVELVRLNQNLPETIQHERLRSSLRDQQMAMQEVRRAHWCHFSAQHLRGLFNSALRSFGTDSHLNLVEATRTDFPVSVGLYHHIAHFLDIGLRDGCSLGTLAITLASAFLMDHYVPGMMLLQPSIVFQTLYLPSMKNGGQVAKNLSNHERHELVELVEQEFVRGFHIISTSTKTSVEFRKDTLMSLSYELGRIQSHTICLYCLVQSAQHCQSCHHSICDNCAQLFGSPAPDTEYQFTLTMCLLCLSENKLVVDVLPPTMNPTILAIDGGGVRGVIPLEYLTLIQENLGQDCDLRDLVDLAVGPSSGGLITLGLIGMQWDVSTCSRTFDRLAKRIFRERRQSTLSRLPRLVFGQNSSLGVILQWLSWFFHDSCYDTRIFDSSLQEAFQEDRRIFGVNSASRQPHSGTKFCVIATSIAKETRSFVFGNFNAVDWFSGKKHEYHLFRAKEVDDEPLIWEVARATAAAPFYFSTANLGLKGSFQDGGLKDNFAADIARRISRRIWPSKSGITRLISMGTGQMDAAQNQSPHFRHVFRDGFLRRSYEAFMSQMDTTSKWLRMKNELDDTTWQDYLRFDVLLKDIPNAIDCTDAMDEYRNLVISQPGSNRMARNAATALLVGRFFFTLECLPERATNMEYAWCRGIIRCKGPTRQIVEALQERHPQQMDFVTDTERLAPFSGQEDICLTCGRYSKPVTVLLRHRDEPTSIYLRVSKEEKWRISGFPNSMSSLAVAQRFESPFGRPDHGRPGTRACRVCDGGKPRGAGKRKRRTSATPDEAPKKRVCNVGSDMVQDPLF